MKWYKNGLLSSLGWIFVLVMGQAGDAPPIRWRTLLDGSTPAGWRGFRKPGFPEKGWIIEDGCLKHIQAGGGGDLVTAGQYEDFELEFEWKLGRGANSGLKYLVTEDRSQAIGIEYQLLDESRSANAAPAKAGKHSTAAAYDLLAPQDIQIRPVGEFNRSRVVLQGNHVEHWLNGVKVLQFELDAPAFRSAIEQSKFKSVNGFAKKQRAHILLQDHGGEVWFRNLRIRELPPLAK